MLSVPNTTDRPTYVPSLEAEEIRAQQHVAIVLSRLTEGERNCIRELVLLLTKKHSFGTARMEPAFWDKVTLSPYRADADTHMFRSALVRLNVKRQNKGTRAYALLIKENGQITIAGTNRHQ